MLQTFFGALLVREPSDGNISLSVRAFEVWFEGLPISLLRYHGKIRILDYVDPKLLVPRRTCAHQVVLLRIGAVSRLCLLTRTFMLLRNQPTDWIIITLVAVWLHSSWVTLGSV